MSMFDICDGRIVDNGTCMVSAIYILSIYQTSFVWSVLNIEKTYTGTLLLNKIFLSITCTTILTCDLLGSNVFHFM